MVRWIFNLDGGPKRVNHAAVAIGDKIYSFGGYSATEVAHQNDFIDVHVLNTCEREYFISANGILFC